MSEGDVHPEDPYIDVALVERLVATQFPRRAHLAIRPAEVGGVDNRAFHLGARMTVRLPSAETYSLQVEKEHRWWPILAPLLPLPIPVPLAKGAPADGYPWHSLAATRHDPPVWFHGDVAWGNLLVEEGRLSAIIDFGTSGMGDPSCDLAIAWTLFKGKSREAFRNALQLDDATWARGRGWTLWKALITLAEHIDTNPSTAEEARRVVVELLADHRHDS